MTDSTLSQIAGLSRMSYDELKDIWRTLSGNEPPAYNRTFLVKRLSYRIQEIAYGGISERAKARMKELTASDGMNANIRSNRTRSAHARQDSLPVAGTRLVREWNGQQYEVTLAINGFDYDGKLYRSLSAVAKAITGTHWNGRAFFGLPKSGDTRRSRE